MAKKNIAKGWIAPDGLMNLKEPRKFQYPYENGYETYAKLTCDNDNGILFLAYYLWLTNPTPEEKQGFINALALTNRVSIGSALYHRHPGRWDCLNSLDNYCGIVAGLVQINLPTYHRSCIANYGKAKHWIYNNVNPGKFTFSAWRQPSDQAFYLIAAGLKPSVFQLLWLNLGILFNASQDPLSKTSETLMTWLRIKSIDKCGEGHVIKFAKRIWLKNLKKHGGIGKVFEKYFNNPKHPCRILSKDLEF